MVLQREAKIPVWGWTDPGKKVTVTLCGKKAKAVADADGKWTVSLPKQKAGGPYPLEVSTDSKKKAVNVFIGDVYLFSGQSNQELPIRRCWDKVADRVKDYTNTDVHILKLPQQFNFVDKQDDCRAGAWVTITPETCQEIAALSYFVGREMQEATGVPVGIINSSVGGTRVECWMSRENLMQFPEYQKELQLPKYNQRNWVDSVRSAENKAAYEWEHSLTAADTVVNKWRNASYDFSSWQPTVLFSDWSKGKNGSYWFRNVINIKAADLAAASKEVLLRLGAMKDADSVFVNGKLVGNTTYEYPPRKYTFASSLLKEGDNEIMVHLISQSGRPNFTKGKLYQLEIGNATIPCENGWVYAIGAQKERKPSQTYFVDTPNGLFNAMIAPLGNIPVKGMVWYQGESNLSKPARYADYLTALISQWRTQFVSVNKKEIPFVVVQLPAYMGHHNGLFESSWCDIRTAQRNVSLSVPGTHLAACLDTGEGNDIHPQDKYTIGRRVALQLRRYCNGEDIVSEGPSPLSARKEGNSIIVSFSPSTGKLKAFADDCAKVTGDYELTIDAAKLNTTSTYTMKDNVLRYCHDDFPECTIFNTDGIASPQFEIKLGE